MLPLRHGPLALLSLPPLLPAHLPWMKMPYFADAVALPPPLPPPSDLAGQHQQAVAIDLRLAM